MTKDTFLLGCGAQKAGTTWLHDYLHNSVAESDLGAAKEYHVLDGLFAPQFAARRVRLREEALQALERDPFDAGRRWRLWQSLSFYANIELYYDYFAGLLATNRGVCLTGDLTPSHSCLPAPAMIKVKEGFARRDVGVKAIFLMRDPVERCWSALRMLKKEGSSKQRMLLDDPGSALEKFARRPAVDARTRYPSTLAALDQAFEPEETFITFYETLFTEESMRRLTDWLGVEFVEADFKRILQESQVFPEPGTETKRRVAEQFRPVYEGVAARFGAGFVESVWPNYRLL